MVLMSEVPMVTLVRMTPEGAVVTPEDGERLVAQFNRDDPEGAYVMVFLEGEDLVMVTDLNDWVPGEDFLFV